MYYYNPYFNMYPYINTVSRPSIFGRLFGGIRGINFSSILSGTQKTLNVVNQTIPLVKQVTPVVRNAKTMFKVMNEFKKVDNKPTKSDKIEKIDKNNNSNVKNINNPTFFQ